MANVRTDVDETNTKEMSFEDYCMAVALLAAMRSKDDNTKVGACIVNSLEKRVVGTGYNRMPTRCTRNSPLPWKREGEYHNTKYPYVCHAAMVAIMNCRREELKCCSIYVSLLPCNDCAKMIIEAGIAKVLYLRNKHEGRDEVEASRKLFDSAGVELKQFTPNENQIIINFKKHLDAQTDAIPMEVRND